MIFRCPNIQTDYNEAVLCIILGTPENNEFSIWDKYLSTLGYVSYLLLEKSNF